MNIETKHLEKLRSIELFSDIKDDEKKLRSFLEICRLAKYSREETIIKEGESGDEMFILFSGAVDILKRTRDGDSYTVVKLQAEWGVAFGELAMVDDDKRSATVLAAEDAEFIVVKKKDFLELGDSDPSLGLPLTRAIAKKISGQLRKTTTDMLTIFDALVSELRDG